MPCYPQSAIAGLNSRSEAPHFRIETEKSSVEDQVLRNGKMLNPVRTGR